MQKVKKIKSYSLEKLIDKYVGRRGTANREKFEYELKLDISKKPNSPKTSSKLR